MLTRLASGMSLFSCEDLGTCIGAVAIGSFVTMMGLTVIAPLFMALYKCIKAVIGCFRLSDEEKALDDSGDGKMQVQEDSSVADNDSK